MNQERSHKTVNHGLDNFSQYSGTWFEIERYQQEDELEADCVSSSYSWGFISRAFRIDRTGKELMNSTIFTRNATGLLSFPQASPTLGLLNITNYADRGTHHMTHEPAC
jgi:hypothetical protein